MKKIFAIAPLLLASLLAHADLIVEQKIESAMVNGNVTYKIKGDLARMDMPNSPAGAMSTLINSKTGDITTLMHGQKMMMKVNMKDAKAQIDAAQKAAGIDASKAQPPKPTGATEKVGQWEAKVYEADLGGMKLKLWAAPDFPNAEALKVQMAKLAEATSGGTMNSKTFDVPGMVVKTEVNGPQGKITTTLLDVKEQSVADSEFQAPTGYEEMKIPGASSPQ